MLRVNLIIVGLVAGTALADVTLRFDGAVDGKPGTTTLQFQGKRALITHEKKDDGRQAVVLRDGEGKRTLVIDHATKSYTEFSDEAASAMKARAEAMRAQLAPQLANLPPEQRQKLEAMMAQQAAPAAAEAKKKAYTFEKKGGTRKVLGKSCQTYVIKVDGEVDGEGCFIAWRDAGISRDALREQLKAAMEGVPVGGQALDESFAHETSPGLPGWRKKVNAAGQVVTETTLTKLSTDSIPAATFEVPKGYTARTLPTGGRPAP